MDPRRLADVQAGDARRSRMVGTGYLIAPRLVLTARHVVIDPAGDRAWERIEVRVGHPGDQYGPVTRCGATVRWVGQADPDVAVLELDQEVEAAGTVAWGRPSGKQALEYNGMAFPRHARGEGGRRIVEQLRGSLPPLAGGGRDHDLYVLDQAAAPSPPTKEDALPWGGASGAAVFCQELLVGVLVTDDTRHGHRRLHAVPVHAFVGDPALQRILTEHGLAVPHPQPVSADPPTGTPDEGARLRVRAVATWAVPLLAVGVLFTAFDLPGGRGAGNPKQPPPSATAGPPSAPDGLAGAADSTVGGLPRGTRLRMTATVSGLDESMAVTFAESDLAGLTDVLEMSAIPAAPMPAAMNRHVETRGYLLAGALVNLVVDGLDGNVEITKVRPVGTVKEPIPLGAAFYFPSQGGGVVRAMDFDMDDTSPVARIPPGATDAGPVGEPFFTSRRITVKQGESERLALNFSTVRAAYVFKVAVNYVAGGKQFSQFIEDGSGRPRVFRISADPCPWDGMRGRLTEQDIRTLGTMHFRHVRTVDKEAVEQGYRLIAADPANRAMGESLCP
ncbi:trypsin-like peptidase domain-containing protein [Streptomyces sp. NPDC002057]|uniref:trypsin-like peptidase domain-containing protein n=1 Tax=Streptomyces sp. NPDC002057 TaxID=3154664 RepID=UPI0033182B2A